MAETTLNDVVKTLQKGQAKDALLARSFDTWFKAMERARLDALEEARERKKAKPLEAKQERSKRPKKDNAKGGFMILGKLIGPLTAFIAGFGALGAALVGFRGWELKAIKSLTDGMDQQARKYLDLTGLRLAYLVNFPLQPGREIEIRKLALGPSAGELSRAFDKIRDHHRIVSADLTQLLPGVRGPFSNETSPVPCSTEQPGPFD